MKINKKKMKKKVISTLVTVITCLIMIMPTLVMAADPGDFTGSDSELSKTTGNMAAIILGVIQVAGTAIAVVMLIWLAVKYMSASPDGKAEIKKSAYIYIVGAILLFGAVALVQMLKGFGGQVNALAGGGSIQ